MIMTEFDDYLYYILIPISTQKIVVLESQQKVLVVQPFILSRSHDRNVAICDQSKLFYDIQLSYARFGEF